MSLDFSVTYFLPTKTMALGSTQPHEKTSTRDVPGGKGSQCVRLTTYHHIVPMSKNLGALTLLDPSGPAWPVMGVLYLYLLQSDMECHISIRSTLSMFYRDYNMQPKISWPSQELFCHLISRYLDSIQDINARISSLTRITEEIKSINMEAESICQMKYPCCD
jgi:hypothetical protein